MVAILVPLSSIELTAEIQQALLIAKQNGFDIDLVVLGVSQTQQFQINIDDQSQFIGSDILSDLNGPFDFYLRYLSREQGVRAPSETNEIVIGMGNGASRLDVWHHPMSGEVCAFSYASANDETEHSKRHLAWVVTLLSLNFPIEDSLTLARAMMNVSRETWATNYADFPVPTLDDARLGIHLDWFTQADRHKFDYLDRQALGLYPVVDHVDWIERLLKLGVKTIQLRIKDPLQQDLEQQVKQAITLGQQYDAQVFINDYWQLAIKYKAFGVHLGQEDIERANLSQLNQAGIRLGLSTHGYFELLRIVQTKPSYIALGHIFPTTTKQMPSKPQGLVRLSLYQRLIDTMPYHHESGYPTVAIGGID